MTVRGVVVVLALVVVGAAGGYALAERTEPAPVTITSAGPVPASDPSIPVDQVAPYAPDVSFPVLQPDLRYQRLQIGIPGFRWSYAAPRGWLVGSIGGSEVKIVPDGNPEGSYGLRVKLVSERKTTEQMVAEKLAALQSLEDQGVADLDVLGRSQDTLAVTFRDNDNHLRYNTFRWFTRPGYDDAQFEMSIVGRAEDQSGLRDLLDQVSASIRFVG